MPLYDGVVVSVPCPIATVTETHQVTRGASLSERRALRFVLVAAVLPTNLRG